MTTFFKHIGIGIISAFTAFTGAFYSPSIPANQNSTTGIVATTSTATTQIIETKKVNPVVNVRSILQTQIQPDTTKNESNRESQINALKAQQALDRANEVSHNTALLKQQTDTATKEAALEEQKTARQNSPACIQAKDSYNAIQKQIDDTNSKLKGELDGISGNGGISQSAQQGLKDNVNANYNRVLADLAIRAQPLMSAYYIACGNDYSVPSQIQIPQQQHTKCSIYDGKISCDTYNTPY